MKYLLLTIFLLTFLACQSLYVPSSNNLQQDINKLKLDIEVNAQSFHGKHKELLIQNWGTPKQINKIDKIEVYRYINSTNLSIGRLSIFIDMFIKSDTVINSKVSPLLD